MRATNAVRARVAASKWRPFSKRKLWLVYGTGETLVVTASMSVPPKFGDEVVLIDATVRDPNLGMGRYRRLYIDFEQHNIEPDDLFGVYMNGGLTEDQMRSPDFECLSHMVNDWFTLVDNHDLTLLVIACGGPLTWGKDFVARV